MPAPPPDNADRQPRAYPQIPQQGPGGFDGQLLVFAEDLREEGLAVGTSEILDSFDALQHVPWTNQVDFKEALAATLAKSPEDRRVFDLVFERFFFRAAEAQAARRGITEGGATGDQSSDNEINLDTLRQQIAAALRDGSDAALQGPGSPGDLRFRPRRGIGRARRRRAADPARARPETRAPARPPRGRPPPRRRPARPVKTFEQHLRRELERNLIERTASFPPSGR